MRALTIVMATLILAVLILSVQPYQFTLAQTTIPLETKALDYVKNVLPINMNHYNITVNTAYSLPSGPNDPTVTQAVDIDLKSNDSTIHVVCVYVNGALHQCGVRPIGIPTADRTYTSLEDVATRILLAHQQQTGLDSTRLLETLNLIKENETTTVNLGDLRLTLSEFPDIIGAQTINGLPVPVASNSSFSISFTWTLSQNGTAISQFNLTFDHNGVLYNLQDERTIAFSGTIISSDSEQQASTPTPTPIAAKQENFSSITMSPQSKNDTSTQSNQLATESLKKTDASQNSFAVPILIAAIAVYMIVMALMINYKRKNQVNKIEREVSKRD